MQTLITVAILILTGVTHVDAIAHSGATGIVKGRMDYFKASPSNLKKIRTHTSNENYALIIPLAGSIASWSAKMSDYFPAGSDIKPFEGFPKTWSDPEGFTAAARLNWKETISLAKAVKIAERDSVITALRDGGKLQIMP